MTVNSQTSTPLYAKRRRRNVITMGLAIAATAFGLTWLVLILGELLWQGFSGLSLAVFTEMTPPPGAAGGLLNPIMGSLIMTAIAVAIGTPPSSSPASTSVPSGISATMCRAISRSNSGLASNWYLSK